MESPTEKNSEPSDWKFKSLSDAELDEEWQRVQRLKDVHSAFDDLDPDDMHRVFVEALERRQDDDTAPGLLEAVSGGIRELVGVEISEWEREEHDDRVKRLARVGRGVRRQDGDASILIRDLAKMLDPKRPGNILGLFRRSRNRKLRAEVLAEYLESERPEHARGRKPKINVDEIHAVLTNPRLRLRGRVTDVLLAAGVLAGDRERAKAQVKATLKA